MKKELSLPVKEEYQKTQGEMLIPKHSASIGISSQLTAVQKKVFNILIYKARNSNHAEDGTYSISVNELKSSLGLPKNDRNNTHIRRQIEELVSIAVRFDLFMRDRGANWSILPLLSSAQIKNGILRFCFPESLKMRFLEPEIFTVLDLVIIQKLSSRYAIALYENLKDFYTHGHVRMSVLQFKEMMGIAHEKYEKITDLKKRVLEPSIEEINGKTDIEARYEIQKDEGVYRYLKFSAKPSKSVNHGSILSELSGRLDKFNKIFKDTKITLTERGEVSIYLFHHAQYNVKTNKILISCNSSKRKNRSFEFDTFDDAKSFMQKNLMI